MGEENADSVETLNSKDGVAEHFRKYFTDKSALAQTEESVKMVFTEKEAAYYLNISPSTLRQQRSDGKRKNRMPMVPYVKFGKSVRYVRRELEEYVNQIVEERKKTRDSH